MHDHVLVTSLLLILCVCTCKWPTGVYKLLLLDVMQEEVGIETDEDAGVVIPDL